MVKKVSGLLKFVVNTSFYVTFGAAGAYLFATAVQLRSPEVEKFIFDYGFATSMIAAMICGSAFSIEERLRVGHPRTLNADGWASIVCSLAFSMLNFAIVVTAPRVTIEGVFVFFLLLFLGLTMILVGIAFWARLREHLSHVRHDTPAKFSNVSRP